MNNLLLEKLRTGDNSEEEFDLVESYFVDENRLKEVDQFLLKDWKNTSGHAIERSISTKIWEEIETTIEPPVPTGFKFPLKYIKWGAVGILLILVAYLGISFLKGGESIASRIVEVKNDSDEVKIVEIGEDIKISLDKGAILKYRKPFRSDFKEIWLVGEAYVEAKNQEKANKCPFIISLDGLSAKIYSNEFNIEAIVGMPFYKFGIFSGQIIFYPDQPFNESAEQIQASGNNLVIYEKEHNRIKSVNLIKENVLAWKEGKVGFDGDPLVIVLDRLEKVFGKPFVYNEKAIANCEINTLINLEDDSPKKILRKLLNPNNIWVSENNGKYILKGKGCS